MWQETLFPLGLFFSEWRWHKTHFPWPIFWVKVTGKTFIYAYFWVWVPWNTLFIFLCEGDRKHIFLWPIILSEGDIKPTFFLGKFCNKADRKHIFLLANCFSESDTNTFSVGLLFEQRWLETYFAHWPIFLVKVKGKSFFYWSILLSTGERIHIFVCPSICLYIAASINR